jgi:aminoglycoside 6'-N-acetyltransferase I
MARPTTSRPSRRSRRSSRAATLPRVRAGRPADLAQAVALARALWPDEPAADHRRHMAAILRGAPPSTLPLTLFVAEEEGRLVGFLEIGLRSHADGCDGRRAVGFIEGWFVVAERRGGGIGGRLMAAASEWAVARGCRELASDTWLDNEGSQRAHQALGFEIVDRCVHLRKALRRPRRKGHPSPSR